MSVPALRMAIRLRLLATALSAFGMALVIVMVGALFPAVGDSIGKLDLPKGVATLLGGADYGTITGWMRSEIGSVYGPLVIAYTGISVAVTSTAGEEEGGILGLTLAYPIERSRLLLAKAGAVAISVVLVALGTLVGLIVGVAVAGGGISAGEPRGAGRCTSRSSDGPSARLRWRSPRPRAARPSPRGAPRRSRSSGSSSTGSRRWSAPWSG